MVDKSPSCSSPSAGSAAGSVLVPSDNPESDTLESSLLADPFFDRIRDIFRSDQAEHANGIHCGIGTSAAVVYDSNFVLSLASDSDRDTDEFRIVSGLVIVGNTEREYSTDISKALVQWASHMEEEFPQENVEMTALDSSLLDPTLATKIQELGVDVKNIRELHRQICACNYINLQVVLGMKVSDDHIKLLCAFLYVLRHMHVHVIEIDLQCCNGFDACWTNSNCHSVSYVERLLCLVNQYIPWPVRILAYKHQTTLNGERVIYPDGSEWKAHFLFDRIRMYTKAYDREAVEADGSSMVHDFMASIAQSCSDERYYAGTGLDAMANCLGALGIVCTYLRRKMVATGMNIDIARVEVTRKLCEQRNQVGFVRLAGLFFTSKMAVMIGTIALSTLAKRGSYWDPAIESVPLFTDSIAVDGQAAELIEKSIRAAVLGQEESLQACLAVLPTLMWLDENHPDSDNWAFLEATESIPSICTALVGTSEGSSESNLIRKYLDGLERTRAFDDAEDASYHLGPPSEEFVEIESSVGLKVGSNKVTADPGQGLRIVAQSDSTFQLRLKGSSVGKLVVQNGHLRFEKGNRWRRAASHIKRIKMLGAGPSGVQVELQCTAEVLSGSAEGICHAVATGTFGSAAAVWLLSQITQGSVNARKPLPCYLKGIVEADESGIKAPPYIGRKVLDRLEYLTDGERLCINFETTAKVIVLCKGNSMYEMHGTSCDLPDVEWKRCTVKGLKPLGSASC